jgi:hypothetical protein
MMTPTPTRHTAVRREDPPEVRIGLERRDESIARKRDDAHTGPGDPAMFANALPDHQAPPISNTADAANNRIERTVSGMRSTVPVTRTIT